MKELNIEEKAKAYDEALKRAKSVFPNDAKTELANAKARVLKYVFPELKESEDERIRQFIIKWFSGKEDWSNRFSVSRQQVLTWLEKQGEHANFRNKILIGDHVTRNRDGVLVNLSQLNRVAKPADVESKEQSEQKPVWSEEDDTFFKAIIRDIENIQYISEYAKKDRINWLKSLRPQKQWKPTDLQIEALESATANCAYSEYQDCLKDLIRTLKAL